MSILFWICMGFVGSMLLWGPLDNMGLGTRLGWFSLALIGLQWFAVWAAQGLLRYKDLQPVRFGRPGQREAGLPFYNHGGKFASVLILTPVMVLIGRHAQDWSTLIAFAACVVGLGTSILMHAQYAKGKEPCCDNNDGRLTLCGYVQMIYMGLAIGVILLGYLMADITGGEAWLITAMMLVYVLIGVVQPSWYVHKRLDYQAKLQLALALPALLVLHFVFFVWL